MLGWPVVVPAHRGKSRRRGATELSYSPASWRAVGYGPQGFCAPRLFEKELASGRAMPIVFYYQRPPSKTASQNTDATLRQHPETVHTIRLGSTCKDRVKRQAVDLTFTIFASHDFRRMGNGKELKKAS